MTPCNGGYEDCGECDGRCDTLVMGTDQENCGACGKSCEGAACNAGKCDPLAVVDSQQEPVGIVSDGTFLYWINQGTTGGTNGSVVRRRIDASDQVFVMRSAEGDPNALVLDDGFLYWVNRNPSLPGPDVNLMRMEVDGDGAIQLETGTSLVGLATDGSTLYWSDQYADEIRQTALPALAGSGTLFAGSQVGPQGVAVDGTHVYWVTGNGLVMRAPKDTMMPAELANGQAGLRSIAVDDKYVYWNADPNVIMRRNLATGAIDMLGSSGAPRDILADGGYVYWTDASNSAVFKIHRDGVPADRQTIVTEGPTFAVAADATRLYWSTTDKIFKMIK